MSDLWLVGSGALAQEYHKVIKSLELSCEVIGRSRVKAKSFEESCGKSVFCGGLDSFIESQRRGAVPSHAIVATSTTSLYGNAMALIRFGVKNILLEKPGALSTRDMESLRLEANRCDATLLIGYNRRFYSSVQKAKTLIEKDGGVVSFHFDFTEWSHRIIELDKPKVELKKWFLCNSTHIVDLAFYLCGKPRDISGTASSHSAWPYSNSIFTGSGKSENGAPFSYHANWVSAGRWGVFINTLKGKYIFEPIEDLKWQPKGSVTVERLDPVDKYDEAFKPGLYLQVEKFMGNNHSGFCSIEEQCDNMKFYNEIFGSEL